MNAAFENAHTVQYSVREPHQAQTSLQLESVSFEHMAFWPAKAEIRTLTQAHNHRFLPTDGETCLDLHTYNR